MKQNTPPRRNGEHHKLYSRSILQIHSLQDLREFFSGSLSQHSAPVRRLGISCHSLRALEKEFSNHIHSISLPHFPLEHISSLIHQLHGKECALAVSVTVLGSILTLSGARAEQYEYDGTNFHVNSETKEVIYLNNLGVESQKDYVVTLTAGGGYELAIGDSGNAGEVLWYWLSNPLSTPATGKPTLTVDVKKGAAFSTTGKFNRSWTVGTHKLFYIKPDEAQKAGMTQEQIDRINQGKLFAEYILDDNGNRSKIN